MKKPKNGHRALERARTNPRYRGKHLVIIENHVYAARSAADAPRLFRRLVRQHPRSTPTLVYIPRADTLILWVAE